MRVACLLKGRERLVTQVVGEIGLRSSGVQSARRQPAVLKECTDTSRIKSLSKRRRIEKGCVGVDKATRSSPVDVGSRPP